MDSATTNGHIQNGASFQEEFAELMAKTRTTPKKVLDRSSLQRTRLRAIMAGDTPTSEEIGRLCRVFPVLKHRLPIQTPVPVAPKHKSFSEALIAAMAVARESYNSLARQLGLTGQTISNWCREVTIPTSANYRALLEILPDLQDAPLPEGFVLEDEEEESAPSEPAQENDMPPVTSHLQLAPTAASNVDRKSLVRLGAQLANLSIEVSAENLYRLHQILVSAGELKAAELAEILADLNPEAANPPAKKQAAE